MNQSMASGNPAKRLDSTRLAVAAAIKSPRSSSLFRFGFLHATNLKVVLVCGPIGTERNKSLLVPYQETPKSTVKAVGSSHKTTLTWDYIQQSAGIVASA